MGTATLFGLFVFWGVVGGLTHAAANWGADIPLVGASGAIAGMIGAYWVAFGPFTKIRTFVVIICYPMQLYVPTGAYVAFWILSQLLGAAGSSEGVGGIAWFAHLGGFAAGALTMFCIKNHTKARLVAIRHGDLHFEAAEQPGEALPEEQTPQLEDAPASCPHCGTPMGEEHQLAANLFRCPNPVCERCIYLEEILPST